MADLSILILSHNKPVFIKEAVQSVLAQTHQNWEAILIDSGVLFRQGFFDFIQDPRIRVRPSGETPEQARTLNMASWCFNNVLRSGELTGDLVLYLCDDDILYPNAFATFWNYYTRLNREPQAMYASEDVGLVEADGRTKTLDRRVADRPAGQYCKGRKLDCQVDYLQFCHTRAILDQMRTAYKTTEYHREDRGHADHADGIFMEQIGALTTVHNIDEVIGMNRRTPGSINLEYADTAFGRSVALMKAKVKGLRRIIDRGYLF